MSTQGLERREVVSSGEHRPGTHMHVALPTLRQTRDVPVRRVRKRWVYITILLSTLPVTLGKFLKYSDITHVKH